MSLVSGENTPPSSPTKLIAPHPRCRNCGHEVHAVYCPRCGQSIADNNQSLWQFIKEFLEEFIQFDSKFLRTIIPLCLKPGFLTSEWTAGRRVRYITPLKLYVTLSALFFLVLSYHRPAEVINIDDSNSSKTPIHVTKKIEGLDSSDQWINDLVANADASESSETDAKNTKKVGAKGATKAKLTGNNSSEEDWFSNFMNSTVGQLGGKTADSASKRQQFSEKFMDRLPTANLILLPIFALIFKALYARRSRFYVEHLVFALHYYAFAFFALTICTLVNHPIVTVPVGIWLVLYLPIAMATNYRQGLFKTLVKCTLFGFMYLMAVSFTALGRVVVTAIQIAHPSLSKSSTGSQKVPSYAEPSAPPSTKS